MFRRKCSVFFGGEKIDLVRIYVHKVINSKVKFKK